MPPPARFRQRSTPRDRICPKDMPQPPGYWKANPSGWSVITLALTSEVLDPSDVYDFADTVVAEQISQVPGVAQVIVSGAEHGAVRIRVDPGPDRGDARFARTDTRGSAQCDAQPAEGTGEPGRPVLEHRRQRPTVQGAGIPRHRRCVAQRRPRDAARCRRGDRRRDQRAAGWLVQQRAGRRHSGVQAAECQHRGDGRCREGIAAAARTLDAAGDQGARHLRPHDADPRSDRPTCN